MRPLVLALSAAVLAFAIAACGGGESEGPAPSAPACDREPSRRRRPTPPRSPRPRRSRQPRRSRPLRRRPQPSETVALEVWFARDAGTLTGEGGTEIELGPLLFSTPRTAESTPAVARAALETLLAGPSDVETAAGVSTAIPAGTQLLDVSIEDGVATVDLSSEFESGGGSLSMMLRLAQVVFTVTQFPTVEGVQFELDGQPVEIFSGEGIVLDRPVTREDYEDLMPMITVETPTIGSHVGAPFGSPAPRTSSRRRSPRGSSTRPATSWWRTSRPRPAAPAVAATTRSSCRSRSPPSSLA